LINDDLEESIDSLEAIVLSERLTRSKASLSAEEQKIVQLADRHRLANVRDRVGPILGSFSNPPPSARP
jgi:predicted ABC-type transport system involved in lysophospholipase L1 biosynthesis ATPase subunit